MPNDKATADAITDELDLGAPRMISAADFGLACRGRLVWPEAFFPPRLEEVVSTESYPARVCRTFSVPRRRRRFPALGTIFKPTPKPSFLVNSGTPERSEGRFPVITQILHAAQPRGYARSPVAARARCKASATNPLIIGLRFRNCCGKLRRGAPTSGD